MLDKIKRLQLKQLIREEIARTINEIGEGVSPFPFKQTGSANVKLWMSYISSIPKRDIRPRTELPVIRYEFKGDKTEYVVRIVGYVTANTYINWGSSSNWKKPHDFDIKINVSFYNKLAGSDSDKEKLTNYGEQFKVMSTVTDIVDEVAKDIMKYKEAKLAEILVYPKLESDETDKSAEETKRGRLYLAYIQKQMNRLPGTWIVTKYKDNFSIINKTTS